MTTRSIGHSVQRREDPRLVTGNGRYLDDLGRDALAAAFVRSPHAHATITGIDITDAWEVDGVEAIYTFEDLDELLARPLPVLFPHPALTHPRSCLAVADTVVEPGVAPSSACRTRCRRRRIR